MFQFIADPGASITGGLKALATRPLFRDLVKSTAFRRLGNVSFLGALQWFWPNATMGGLKELTRDKHSFNVGLLAIEAGELMGESEKSDELIASALLHDIGHFPFSHSAEPIFGKLFGINHKSTALNILRGGERAFSDVREILLDHKVNIDNVCDSFSRSASLVSHLLLSPINVDTIDGILRSASFFNVDTDKVSRKDLIDCLVHPEPWKSPQTDVFWQLKDQVYRHIYGNTASSIEEAFRTIVTLRSDRLHSSDWNLTDAELIEKLSLRSDELRTIFERIAVDKQPKRLARDRKFAINSRVKLRGWRDFYGRYQDSKRREPSDIQAVAA